MAMKLSTGKIAFPIEFDNGAKEVIYINPNDPDLFVRFSKFEEKIGERIKDVGNFELSADGTPKDDKLAEKVDAVIGVVREELDVAFASDVSSVLFRYCSPFAVVNGEYFLIQFMKAIKPEIDKQNKKASADLQKKMGKHLNKYAK